MIGIYKIENLITHRVYIGQSINIQHRWRDHKCALNGNYHANNHLQSSWNLYGMSAFKFSVVEECNIDNINNREIYWIKYYNSYENGYNQDSGGCLNKTMSISTKQKISLSKMGCKCWNKGIPTDEQTKQKISISKKGKKLSETHKLNISRSKKGKKPSLEHLKKLSESRTGIKHKKHKPRPPISEETRQKLRLAKLGKKRINK